MFDKNSFLAGLAVGRRITAMLQNNVSVPSVDNAEAQKEIIIEKPEKEENEDG